MKPADLAGARNKALWGAGYPTGFAIGRSEWFERPTGVALEQRRKAFAECGVYFTPQDVCMVYERGKLPHEEFAILTSKRERELRRPWRVLVGTEDATDKRGGVRRWASSKAALAAARKIERELLGLPPPKRVGTKRKEEPAPGGLLALMER